MRTLEIIEKKDKYPFLSVGEVRYIGQVLEHSYKDDYEYTKIWVGQLDKNDIRIKVSGNGLIFIRFNNKNSELLKDIEAKHKKCSLGECEAVLYSGELTILTKLK